MPLKIILGNTGEGKATKAGFCFVWEQGTDVVRTVFLKSSSSNGGERTGLDVGEEWRQEDTQSPEQKEKTLGPESGCGRGMGKGRR